MQLVTKTKLIKSITDKLPSAIISKECITVSTSVGYKYTITLVQNGVSLNRYIDNVHHTEILFNYINSGSVFNQMSQEEKQYIEALGTLIDVHQDLIEQINNPFADILTDFGV